MNMIVSDTFRAKFISWVTMTIVICSAANCFMTVRISPVNSGSSADVGSSKNRISGFIASALAIETLCCWPPDSSQGYRDGGPDIRALDSLVETIERILNDKKREMALDAPLVPSIVVKNAIENQVREIKDVISPTPVTSQLDGVWVKLNYDSYADVVSNVVIDGKKLSEIAEIKKSKMYDYILVKINTESSLVEDSN